MKYTYKWFKKMTELPLEDKLIWTEQVILGALKENKTPAVSLSWGKDSIVMLDLVRKHCKNTLVLYANTKCEYPETYKYRDEMLIGYFKGINYVETEPIKTFWECVEEYGFPEIRTNKKGKYRQPKCCLFLKERPLMRKEKELGVDCVFMGLQATESMHRRLLLLRMGEYYFNKQQKRNIVLPLAIWNNQDVWEYAELNNIPMNPIYEKMDRNGCMFCTGFKNWQKVMSKYNPNLTAGIMRKMGQSTMRDCVQNTA